MKKRIFTLWIVEAPNRYLLDRISELGNWKTTYIQWNDDIDKKVDEFYNNFKSPVLTDIKIDWGWLKTSDILPYNFSDLYAWQPLYIYWKYSWKLDKQVNIKISWIMWNDEYSEVIPFTFKNDNQENFSLPSLWARKKVKEIYKDNYFEKNDKLEKEVTQLWLDYSIMTEFTSFVAIDDQVRNEKWKPTTIEVPKYEVEWKLYESYNNWWIGKSISANSLRWWINTMNYSIDSVSNSISWNDFETTLTNIISYLYIIPLFLFIWWWIRIFTASWDKDKIKKWKRILIIATILIIIIFLISILINWILTSNYGSIA